MNTRHWLILITIGSAFGASFALNEVLLAAFGPLTISALRVGIGALGCWLWVLLSGKPLSLPRKAIPGLFILGSFQFSLPFAVFPLAQGQITSSVAGIAGAMTPVLVVLLSHVRAGGEHASAAKVAGVAFGLAGAAILASGGAESGISDWRFVLLAMISPLCYAIALTYVSRFRGIDPVVVTTGAMTAGALVIAPMAILVEGVPAEATPGDFGNLAVLGLGLTTLPFLILYAILPRVGATNVSLVTFVAPVSSLAIGTLILHEPTGPAQFVGVSLILLGLVTIDGRVPRRIIGAVGPARPVGQAREAVPVPATVSPRTAA